MIGAGGIQRVCAMYVSSMKKGLFWPNMSESDVSRHHVSRHQILTYKDVPRTKRIKIFLIKDLRQEMIQGSPNVYEEYGELGTNSTHLAVLNFCLFFTYTSF